MRRTTLAIVAVLAMLPVSAFAQSVEIGPDGLRVQTDRSERSESCQELRSACLNKERLGEVGEGNCRRYRETCRR